MKINLSFIPQNTAPLGARSIGLYDSNGNKLRNIPLGNLAPKSTGNMLYRFGALSDVHLPYNTGPEDFARALNYFNNTEKVNFICISGDMGSTGVDSEWANFKAQVDAHSPNTTVHISAGNHDAGQSAHKTHDYPIPYTGNPLYYSFTQGDDVFIMFGMTFWGNPPFSKESLQWLYETLEENRNKRCFVFQHMMRKGHAGDASGRYTFDGLDNINGKVFLSLMEHYKNVLWFHGHSHCEFEQQDTLALPNSNYDRAFGCHSIHIPSCCMTRNESNSYDYEDSEGYVVDVYKNGIHLRARDFIAGKFLPIASYWIDTTPTAITANSYTDSTGTINTGSSTPSEPSEPSDGTTLPEGTTYTLNARDSYSGKATKNEAGMIRFYIPCEADTTYKLSVENLPIDVTSSSALGNTGALFCWDANKTNVSVVQDIENSSIIQMINLGNLGEIGADNKSFFMSFTTSTNASYIALSLVISTTEAITEEDIKDVVITLEKVYDENYTNVLPLSIDENGNDFVGTNGEDGYKTGYRLRSNGTETEQENACVTGFIPCDDVYVKIRMKNYTLYYPEQQDSLVDRIAYYNSNKELVLQHAIFTSVNGVEEDGGGIIIKPYVQVAEIAYFRISTGVINENTIITINEEIVIQDEIYTNVLPLAINEDGTDFVGSNGQDGYTTGYRFNSQGVKVEFDNVCATGYIPVTRNDVIRMANFTLYNPKENDGSGDKIVLYDANKQFVITSTLFASVVDAITVEENDVYLIKPSLISTQEVAYFRICTGVINENTIITINEPIIIEKPFVNLVPMLLDTDLTNVYNKTGYRVNARVKSTGEVIDIETSYRNTLTGMIPVKDGDVLHIRGVDTVLYLDARHCGVISLWDSTGGFLASSVLIPKAAVSTDENGDFAMSIDYGTLGITDYPTTSYIRIQLGEITSKLIITKNQLITES